jgi:hypothetical protein
METIVRDKSIMEAVFRRRKRSVVLSELAVELGRDVLVGRPLEEEVPVFSNENVGENFAKSVVSPLIGDNPVVEATAEANIREKAEDSSTAEELLVDVIENEIDEGLMGDLGSGKSNYDMLDELIPQLDFGAIPLTQPKRVMAKSGLGDQSMSTSDSANNTADGKATKSKTSRAKKPATLLDSYFKDF